MVYGGAHVCRGWGLQSASRSPPTSCERAAEMQISTPLLNMTVSVPSDTDHIVVMLSKEAGLVKIIWTSRPIEEDRSGRKGRQLYDDIKKSLTTRFGQGPTKVLEWTGQRLYSNRDQFYECLLSGRECGRWATLWVVKPGKEEGALLEIEGRRRGADFITVQYQGPAFETVSQHIQRREQESRQKAFERCAIVLVYPSLTS